MRIKLMLLTAGLAVMVASGTQPAGAEDAKPTPCNGMLLKDKAGDQTIAPVGGGSASLPHGSKGPDNLDVRGLFFNYAPGADGKPVLTANIVIENLTATVPAEARSGQVRYLVDFGTMGDVAYLTAVLKSSGWSFVYGESVDIPDPGGSAQLQEAATKGRVFEGPQGVIQIEMPPSAKVEPGTNMTGVITRVSAGNEETLFVSDQAPDGGTAAAVPYTVTPCPAAEPPAADPQAPATPAPPATTTTLPATTPAHQNKPAEQSKSAPAKKKASKKAACQKKAKKVKNAKKRKAALKKCSKIKG
jgi:hypothetical protein